MWTQSQAWNVSMMTLLESLLIILIVLCLWSRTGKKKFTIHFKKHGVHFKHAYCVFQRYRKQVDSRVGGGAKLFKIHYFSVFPGAERQGKRGQVFCSFLPPAQCKFLLCILFCSFSPKSSVSVVTITSEMYPMLQQCIWESCYWPAGSIKCILNHYCPGSSVKRWMVVWYRIMESYRELWKFLSHFRSGSKYLWILNNVAKHSQFRIYVVSAMLTYVLTSCNPTVQFCGLGTQAVCWVIHEPNPQS